MVYVHVRVVCTGPLVACTLAVMTMVPVPVGSSITGMECATPDASVAVANCTPLTVSVWVIWLPVSLVTVYGVGYKFEVRQDEARAQ